MGIFGWSYPPGAENDPYAPYNQDWEEDEGDDEKDEGLVHDVWDLLREVEGIERSDETVERAHQIIARRLFKSTACGISFWTDGKTVSVGGYCEGWDGECQHIPLQYPFPIDKFWEACDQADVDGCAAWGEAL